METLTIDAARKTSQMREDSRSSVDLSSIDLFGKTSGKPGENLSTLSSFERTSLIPFDAASVLWKSVHDGVDTVAKFANGAYDKLALPLVHIFDSKEASHQSEERLRASIEKSVHDPKVRADLNKDLKLLKERATSTPLTDSQVAKTLDSVNALIESAGSREKGKVAPEMRLIAARAILNNAADPEVIAQGAHPTCGVSSLGHKMFVRHPDIAADMVASAALKGEWKGPDGKVVKIPNGSLIPGREEGRYPVGNGERNYASKLFEVVAINDIGQHVKPEMSYLEETKIGDDGRIKGEHPYWIFADGKKKDFEEAGHGIFSTTGGLTAFGVAAEVTRLTGETNGVFTDREFDDDDTPAEFLPHPGIKNDNLTDIRSAKQLEDNLRDFKQQNRLPIECIVWARGAADLTGKTADQVDDPKMKGKTQPDHVITVDDYRPAADGKPAQVRLHNQWGRSYNGWMELDKFFKCMK